MKKLFLFLKICGGIVLILMVIRTIVFMSWFLNQKRYIVDPDFWQSQAAAAQYDWSLWLTATGWMVLFFWFTGSQKKHLADSGDYQHITKRMPSFWLLNKGWKPDDEEKKSEGK